MGVLRGYSINCGFCAHAAQWIRCTRRPVDSVDTPLSGFCVHAAVLAL